MCHEDDPSDPLPAYPSMPASLGADALMAYVRAQSDWAVQAAGIYRREKARRAATSRCLADLRRQGLIN